MSSHAESSSVRNCRLFSHAASAATIVAGSLALFGWLPGIPALTSIFPGLASMKPNTALCFVLAGVSLWLIQLRPGELISPRVRRIQVARVVSGGVGLIGLLTLVEYLFHVNLDIDAGFSYRGLLASEVLHPARMAGTTALGFLLLGSGGLLTTFRRPYAAQGLALLTSLNGFIPCVGYLLGVRTLYDTAAYSSMALLSAMLFVGMGLAVLAARPRLGAMAAITSERTGGVMAQRVLPLVVGLPIFFGWLRWRGELAGLFDSQFGIALLVIGEVVTFCALVWMRAVGLNHDDRERLRSEGRTSHLAAIVESSGDAIFSKDMQGTVVSWNQGAERLYGYRAAEIVGKSIVTIIPEELQAEATEFLGEIAAGRVVTCEEAIRRRRDGTELYVSLIISPVRDSEGRIVGASTIAHDITERKRAEEALRDSELRYRRLFETAKDGILILDAHSGRIVDVNPFLTSLLDYPREDFLGRTLWDLGSFRQVQESKAAFQELQGQQYIRYEDLPLETRTGRRVYVEFVSNVYGVNGKSVIQCNIRDITARKEAEESSAAQARKLTGRTEELVRSQQALEDKTRMLQSVLDSMSEGLITADEHGKLVLWNPAADKIVGPRAANVSHQEWTRHYEVFLPDKVTPLPPERNPLAGAIRGEASTAVLFIRNPRLTEGVFVEVHANPLRDKKGVVCGGVSVFRDITERMRSEERLREYERVVEDLEDMVVVVDREYRYVIANRAFLNYREMKREQVLGRRVDEVVDKGIFEAVVKEKMDECFEGKVIGYELEFSYPKRGLRSLFASYFPIEGPKGIDRIACVLRDITEGKLAEEKLRKSEERFSKAFCNSPLASTISTEADGRYLDVNDAYLEMVGRKREDVIGRTTAELDFWAHPPQRNEMIRLLREGGPVTELRTQYKTSTGEIREADLSAELIELEGQPCVLAISRDITETLQLEAQYRQAQKMEAVGRLAGGVAHDFNNMLGVIIGYSDLLLGMVGEDVSANRHLEQIKKASHRAVGLTRQLLTFSRQQVVFPKNLDLNEVVQNVTTMLQRLVGEDVAMSFRPTVPIGSINADPGQIEQILMNLVVNARDAMPGGGEIILETGHAELDEHYVSRHPGSHRGQHVVLVVSDTGCGMEEGVKARIFEPFFTTKEVGRGTGLGLATVYGIVKQGGGSIYVYSEPAKGTTFKIYFPRVGAKAEPLVGSREETELPGGSEAILVVEDDEPLRDLTVRMLQDAGYRVTEAKNAEVALEMVKRSKPGFDLLLTDVILPGKSGVELLEQAKAVDPGICSLFMSGYAGDLVALRGGVVPEAAFIEKPFTRSSLLKKVRSALHSEPEIRQAS